MLTTTVYGYLSNDGDGSVSLTWYLTQVDADKARKVDEDEYNQFTDSETVEAETFVGSNIYEEAVSNSTELNEEDEEDEEEEEGE